MLTSEQVLQGLQFIHDRLKLVHGAVNADTVIVNRDGSVKLGLCVTTKCGREVSDLASQQRLVRGKPSVGHAQDDYRALGLLMMFMMGEKIDSAVTNFEVQRPEEWDSDINKFLKKTATSSGDELRKVRR